MPTKFKSPYASTFTTGVKNGTPASTVVWNIAKKYNKPVNTIWNSLFKAGLCFRQKFNGTWVYWPSFTFKSNTKNSTITQTTMWQSFIDWCLVSGFCTPNQLNNSAISQKQFMTYCRTFFGKQFSATPKIKRSPKRRPTRKSSRKAVTAPKTKWTKHTRKNTTKRNRKTTGTAWTGSFTRNYKFPSFKTRSAARRYVRAA